MVESLIREQKNELAGVIVRAVPSASSAGAGLLQALRKVTASTAFR